ncbi:MAG: hypothetical protein JWN52_3036 [Actinomycetia bacterium]|nr:hypothetical protein [Actinomycetes bacterium]
MFLRSAESLAVLVELPSGLGPMDADECEIDMVVFEAFVDALVRRYVRSNHVVLRSLMQGFIATAVVLVERGEGRVPALEASSADSGLGQLAELSRRHEAAMVC